MRVDHAQAGGVGRWDQFLTEARRVGHLCPRHAQDLDVIFDLCVVANQHTAPGQDTAADVP